jgi:hypothetical protein
MFSFIVFTVKVSHASGLIGQQTEIVFVILNLFLNNVLEFTGNAAASITRQTRSERVCIAQAIFSVAAAVLQILI